MYCNHIPQANKRVNKIFLHEVQMYISAISCKCLRTENMTLRYVKILLASLYVRLIILQCKLLHKHENLNQMYKKLTTDKIPLKVLVC